MLTPEQRTLYERDGFLVLPGFKSTGDCDALRWRARALVEAFDPGDRRAVFSSVQPQRLADAALIASAEAMHCFFEEESFDDQGRLRQAKALSINKIGHAMHDLDPLFDAFSHGPALASLAADLGLVQPQIWQSMVIFKQPGIGGEVRWHQDASFFVTRPSTVTAFWFALEDATRSNGCLWVQPGGQCTPLRERFVRHGDALRLYRLDDTPWPTAAQAVPVEVAAGTLVCMHGHLPHYSAPNRSPQSRMAYTLHVTDGTAAYAADNWLQRRHLRLRGF